MQSVKLRFNQMNEEYRIKEAFKTLRTNIEFCGNDVKVVAVTSCTPNEGKSSISMKLARAFAEAGYKSILIDADMRKSVLVGRYRTKQVKRGLTHCLAGRATADDVICETNIDNLYVIFAGPVPPNPSELLGSEGFSKLVSELRRDFDYVIIDTTSMFSVLNLTLLDLSTIITFLGVVDFIPTIKNMKIGNETLQSLNYDANKIRLVLNRSDSATQLSIREVEEKTLGSSFYHVLSNDFHAANESIQTGIPLVLRKNNNQLTKDLRQLVALYTNHTYQEEADFDEPARKSGGWFSKLFS